MLSSSCGSWSSSPRNAYSIKGDEMMDAELIEWVTIVGLKLCCMAFALLVLTIVRINTLRAKDMNR